VSSPLGGSLLRIELRAGDRVEAASVVARIAPMESPLLDPRAKAEAVSRSAATVAGERQAQAAVSRADVASRHAADELSRSQRLVASGALAPDALLRSELEARLRTEELSSARFGAQMATHEAAMARAAVARFDSSRTKEGFDVPAPITGQVLRVIAQSAGPVAAGTPLIEVGDPAALEVVADVLSADAVRITPGARVTLERRGGPTLAAHVRRVEPSGFTRLSALGVEEQRVPIVVDLDDPRERWVALGDGYRVEARVVVEQKHDVLRAPIGAVFRRGDQWATYVVEDGRARIAVVALGARNDSTVEVLGGLATRSQVVVHPSEQVKNGTRVAAR
jgi:HlyD family secretion protein